MRPESRRMLWLRFLLPLSSSPLPLPSPSPGGTCAQSLEHTETTFGRLTAFAGYVKQIRECFDIIEIGPIHRTGNEGSSSSLSKNAANLDFVLSMRWSSEVLQAKEEDDASSHVYITDYCYPQRGSGIQK